MYALSNEVYVRRSVQGAVLNTAPQGHFMKLMTFTECHLEALCEPQMMSVGSSEPPLKKCLKTQISNIF